MEITIDKCPFDIERLEREVNILLISDLHYDIKKPLPGSLLAGPDINSLLVQSIESAGKNWQPDLVIVAGDLVNFGDPANYVHYFDIIEKLVHKYPHLRYSTYSTPGNHDVTRRNKCRYKKRIRGYIDTLCGTEILESNTVNRTVGKLFTLSKRSIINNQNLLHTLDEFEKFYFETYLEMRGELSKELGAPLDVTFPVPSIKTVYFANILGINVACHNSSFFSDLSKTGDDRNNLFLVRDLVIKMNKSLPKTGVVISFMHHPYYFLHESEYIAPLVRDNLEEKNNNFSRILESSHLILSGHVHGHLQDPTYQQHHAYLITNGTSYTSALFEGKCYPYTYALLKVNKQSNWFAMKKFIYRHSEIKEERAYELITDDQPHYELRRLPDQKLTSLETEKLRVLEYFRGLSKEVEPARQYKFFAYQLGLYQHEFRFSEKKLFTIYEGKVSCILNHNNIDVSTLLITSTYDIKNTWIYKVEGIKYPVVISKLLNEQHTHGIPPTARIYFSINHELLLRDNGEPDSEKIDNLLNYYRSLTMLSKKENVSINMLYH